MAINIKETFLKCESITVNMNESLLNRILIIHSIHSSLNKANFNKIKNKSVNKSNQYLMDYMNNLVKRRESHKI